MLQKKEPLFWLCVGLWVFLAISVLLLLRLGFFTRPQADDFTYSLLTHEAAQSGSLGKVLCAAVQQAAQTWREWQGSYSAVFLFSLQPGIWNERLYFLAPAALLLSLIGATLFFSRALLEKRLGLSRVCAQVIGLGVSLLSVHLLPSPAQGIFWWNGGIYYVFFYALSLVLFGLLLLPEREKPWWERGLRGAGLFFLGAILGGGNYITLLPSLLLLLSGSVCALRKRSAQAPSWLGRAGGSGRRIFAQRSLAGQRGAGGKLFRHSRRD